MEIILIVEKYAFKKKNILTVLLDVAWGQEWMAESTGTKSSGMMRLFVGAVCRVSLSRHIKSYNVRTRVVCTASLDEIHVFSIQGPQSPHSSPMGVGRREEKN